MVWVFQTYTVTLYGLYHLVDSCILSNHGSFQRLCHTFQTDSFFFSHPLSWHTCHHRYDLCHLFCINHLTLFTFTLAPSLIKSLQCAFELRLTITITCSQFEVLILYSKLLHLLNSSNLFLRFNDLWWDLSITKMYT